MREIVNLEVPSWIAVRGARVLNGFGLGSEDGVESISLRMVVYSPIVF